ncbi:MAG: electron transporter RnfB [Deltaproteobacteria bacterium HGW-Deltaproteobacteria-15]|jgi:NADPH-dependent glutamate synthase beta subunit-like oxidoreductase|nr:MAG: electron transporter RnfB [Deltaproteobacteria bacterium HGW-Deltaproteobacteria-15]
MTLTDKDFNPQFKSEIAGMPGGEQVKRCYDCGTCTGACPASESGSGFDPRKILHMIKMGMKDQLLGSPTIWHCTHCDTCVFACPQNVRFSAVVDVLREMAVQQGYASGEGREKWGTAPCKATCPAHISIPGFVSAVAEGRYEEGLKLIKEEMPFPGICGRICPHPCEEECNRGKVDKPVAIEYLKRFLADGELTKGKAYIPDKKAPKKERVAVIGAGPAGLTAAYYLAIEGYGVTVFEKHPVAGGMMALGIPEFRLPRNILNAEIEVIRKLGVEIRLNVEIGKDTGFADLQRDYQAVFLGIGCQQAIKLGIPGEETFSGVVDGLEFLREINLGNPPASRGRLVIVGGGNTAVDCARTAMRLGYESVAILYRRTREEMPANSWEVEDTIEEEIEIRYLTLPVRILGENGKVTGVECVRMELGEPDQSGRRRPVRIEGSEFTIQADMVVAALGQTVDLRCLPRPLERTISNRGFLVADPQTGLTKAPLVFSGGDVVSGPRTVVEAIAFGKKAARSIDRVLRGEVARKDGAPQWKGIGYSPETVEKREREIMPRLSLTERKSTFEEVDRGFDDQQARCEAERCFRICGIQRERE